MEACIRNSVRQYMLKICERNLLYFLEVGKKPMVMYYNRSCVFNCRCTISNYASIATNKSDQELIQEAAANHTLMPQLLENMKSVTFHQRHCVGTPHGHTARVYPSNHGITHLPNLVWGASGLDVVLGLGRGRRTRVVL